MDSLMDKHLMDVEREVKSALERFEKYGVDVDKKFINYFQKLSIDR